MKNILTAILSLLVAAVGARAAFTPYRGVNVQIASYTLIANDLGKLVVMNCSSACTVTLYGSPTEGYYGGIESIGPVLATVSLNGKLFNTASTAPTVIANHSIAFWSDGTNYYGDAGTTCSLAKYTINYNDSTLTGVSSATPTKTLFTLPSTSTRICLLEIMPTASFTGISNETAATVKLQSGASSPQAYSPNQDIYGAASTTGTVTSSSNQITSIASLSNVFVGGSVAGAGIPAGTTVTAINTSGSSATMSATATATGSAEALTFNAFGSGLVTNDYWTDLGNAADRTNQSVVAAFTFTCSTGNCYSSGLAGGSATITIGTQTMP